MPLHTPFDEIDLATLQRLVDDEVPEDRQLEFKRELNLNTKEQKREFLADVSAFANADGGHLILGIAEQNGVPVESGGFQRTDSNDDLLQQIQNLVRDGVEPNIHGIDIKAVDVNEDKVALVIHIPASWSKPHWVSRGGHRTFYSRNSNGKYPLDIPELRQLFTLSETVAERIRNFRVERIAAILEGAIPVQLKPGPKLVLHVVPFSAVTSTMQFDLSGLKQMRSNLWMGQFFYNFEGIYEGPAREGTRQYQVFRNGTLEFVSNLKQHFEDEIFAPDIGLLISEHFLPRAMEWFDTLKVSPPMLFVLSVLNVRNHKMTIRTRGRGCFPPGSIDPSEMRPISDKDNLLVSEVRVDSYERDSAKLMRILRPALDAAWQASGWPHAKGYAENGNWFGFKDLY